MRGLRHCSAKHWRPAVLWFVVISPVVIGWGVVSRPSQAETVVVGDIFPYSLVPAHARSYKNGAQLALESVDSGAYQINWLSLDSKGDPSSVSRLAKRLIAREEAVMITGTFFSHVALAMAEQARRQGFVFLAAEPLADSLTMAQGNRYTFRLRPSTSMQVKMLLSYARSVGLEPAPTTKVTTIAPDYAYGQDAVAAFKRHFLAQHFTEQWPGLNRIDAAAEVQALVRQAPDIVFNVTFGSDLAKLVRELRTAAPDFDAQVFSLLSGEPEYLQPLGAEAPQGWIVTGYPSALQMEGAHGAFVRAYQQRYGEPPMLGGLVGYMTIQSVAAALRRAGTTETESLRQAFLDLPVQTPVGDIVFRAADHQSTMGTWVGRLSEKDGQVGLHTSQYYSGAEHLPSIKEVKAIRPQQN